jgi:hypothetical protein
MDRMRAFIHIGLAKTGTKSIQFALAQRRSKLLHAGWLFPTLGTSTNRSGHHGLAWHLQRASHEHPALRNFELASFRATIAAAVNHNVVISSEGLSALSADQQGIRSLLALFPNHEVFVIAYVREQAELLNSLYAQILDDLTYPGSIHEFVGRAMAHGRFKYLNLFHSWQSVLGERLLVRPFDTQELRCGDVVKDFAGLLGLNEPLKPLPPDRKNKQPNPLQLAVLIGMIRRLAASGETWTLYSDRHRYLRKLIAEILDDPELAMDEAYWGIGPVWIKRVREHYEQPNAAFFSSVLGREFSFTATTRVRRRNAIGYAELPLSLRSRLEARLSDGLADAPREAVPASGSADLLALS